MADFSALIASIRVQIRANGRQLITGPVMQASLLEIIDAVNAAKQDTLTFDSDPTEDSENPVTSGGVWRITSALTDSLANLAVGVQEGYDELLGRINGKQDIIADLDEIRAGALLGSTAYQRPADGIPFEDLTHSVQVSLESADNALKPNPAYDGQIPVYNEDGDIMGSGITPADVVAKADQDGTYPDLTAGAVLAAAVPAEYLYRPCPAPMDGKAVLDTIKGKSIVSSGQLINNAAEGIKTVGRNQINVADAELGTYNQTTGALVDNTSVVRCWFPLVPGASYYINIPAGLRQDSNGVGFYRSDKSYTGQHSLYTRPDFVAPSDARFGLLVLRAVSGTITLDMVKSSLLCINLSDTAFNGQYEPYKESELQLGLNSFQVTDGTNTITVNGLKSAGSVYDEIKDGKYIKKVETRAYQSGDESDATVITDGTNTNATLATPVEYDLVSKIPNSYQVYEGGTEEILSDAIVAPFCASIRYPASPEGLTIVDMLTALKAAGVISDFAVTVDAATSKKTLTITA